jgi:hypothetical protein
MQFVFKGVPGESHESINMYGTVFPLGEPVEMADAKFAAKLANHPHFYAVAEPAVTDETQTQEPAHEEAQEPVKRGPGRPRKA